jgi:hypothetical protein
MPEQFDSLFALTFELQIDDWWMNDNECWEPGQVFSLYSPTKPFYFAPCNHKTLKERVLKALTS